MTDVTAKIKQYFGHITLSVILIVLVNMSVAQIPTAGLVGYWPFNGNANDMSGNANHGTLGGANGGPFLTTDRFGNANSCYEFGGYYNPNWIDVPNSASLQFDTTVSVSFWIQECFNGGMDGNASFSTTEYNYAVIAKGGDGWSCPPGLWVFTQHSSSNPGGFFGLLLSNTVSNGNFIIHDDGPRDHCMGVNSCDWLHCAIVMDGRHVTYYWNSVVVMDTVFPSCVNFVAANTHDMHIGIEGGYFWNPREGKLDDIAIYNRAITAQEVSQLFGQFYIIPPQDTTIVAMETCGSYNWNGVTYDSSGVYVQHLTTAQGCDSVVVLHLTVNPLPVLNHTPSMTIQAGETVNLWASGADVLYWSDANGNILSSNSSLTVSPTTTTLYVLTGQSYSVATENNLVTNGDFQQGNVGFSSSYYYSSNLWPEGYYYIGPNAHNYHTGFNSWHDHTTGTGNYMIVNGAVSPNMNVWTQTVAVTPHTDYAFSTWVCTVGGTPQNTSELARLQFSVNGIQLGNVFIAPNSYGVWSNYYEVWNSGNSTTAVLTILNQNTTGGGNDFGIDDIVFAPLNECSTTEQIYLHVFEYPDNVDSADCTFYPDGTEWGIVVDWSSDPIISNHNIPLVGDLDNDGHPEVVCFSTEGEIASDPYKANVILVFDGVTRQCKQTIHLPTYVTAFDAAAYALVKLPNQKGLIVVAGYDYKLRAYDITSITPDTPYWISDVNYGENYGDWAVNIGFADFNCDGHPEVYVRDKIYNAETGVLLASANSQNTGSSFAHWTHSTHYKLSSPFAANLYGGIAPEFLLGNEIYAVNISNSNGLSGNNMTLVKQIVPPGGATTDGHAQVADFNSDGYVDVFISVRSTDANNGTVYGYVWDVHNNVLSNPLVIQTNWSGKSIATIADIDGDNLLEIVIHCGVQGSNEKLRAYKYNPTSMSFSLLWGFVTDEDSYSNAVTAFDFNQDGILELLICDQSMVRIVNGSGKSHITHVDTLPVYAMNTFPFSETTIMQYPVIVDVDADGSADFISVGSNRLNFFKSAVTPWAPARKVWNQYMYNVTNVNEDLTIPQYLFSNATTFTDPQGMLRRPFNNFLQQATTIDRYGRPFYAVTDVAMGMYYASQLTADSLILNFTYCNVGDIGLNAPYPITVFLNTFGGDTVCTTVVNDNLPVDSCAQGEIHLPLDFFCGMQNIDSLVVALNCAGNGIAQNGGLQPECDMTNNTASIPVIIPPQTDTVYIDAQACDSYIWNGVTYNTSGVYVQTFTNIHNCDSMVYLTLNMNYSDLTEFADTICQHTEYSGYGFTLSDEETGASGTVIRERILSNQFGCDSLIRLNLYVRPTITPDFYADPDKAMLSENPLIQFVNNTDISDIAQTPHYWFWDFGDGETDTTLTSNNEHLYTQWGDYMVTLTLWANGCMDSLSLPVSIEADLIFPNVITPNGDGVNDVFCIKNLNPNRQNHLYIADRWGRAVWKQENYQTYMKDDIIYNADQGFCANDLPDGVYFYAFYYEGAVRTLRFNGTITVIRDRH